MSPRYCKCDAAGSVHLSSLHDDGALPWGLGPHGFNAPICPTYYDGCNCTEAEDPRLRAAIAGVVRHRSAYLPDSVLVDQIMDVVGAIKNVSDR